MEDKMKELIVTCLNVVAESKKEKEAYTIDSFRNGYVTFAREVLAAFGIEC